MESPLPSLPKKLQADDAGAKVGDVVGESWARARYEHERGRDTESMGQGGDVGRRERSADENLNTPSTKQSGARRTSSSVNRASEFVRGV